MRSWAQVTAQSGRAAPGGGSSRRRPQLNVVPIRQMIWAGRWEEETELEWDDMVPDTSPPTSPDDTDSEWGSASPVPSPTAWSGADTPRDPAPPVHNEPTNHRNSLSSDRLQTATPPPTVEAPEMQSPDEAIIALLEQCISLGMEQGGDERQKLVELAVGALKREQERRKEREKEGGRDVCVVCCGERANTVLMPCRHLVMCGTCCNKMEIQELGWGRSDVPCPVCRTVVEDRVCSQRVWVLSD